MLLAVQFHFMLDDQSIFVKKDGTVLTRCRKIQCARDDLYSGITINPHINSGKIMLVFEDTQDYFRAQNYIIVDFPKHISK